MVKKTLIALGALVALFLIVVATRPSTYRVERTAEMSAPSDIAFAWVNDFHRWDEWSPWAKLDPAMKKTFDGAPAGEGAVYSWAGNDKVGEGKMTIVESRPGELVKIKLEFLKPWASTNTASFAFKPAGEKTAVTWSMEGNNDFAAKAFSLFMDMDSMIGKDFESGLASMRTLAESEAKKVAEAQAQAKEAPAEAPATP